MQPAVPLRLQSDGGRSATQAAAAQIPRLLLMRWDGIEFWERHLCERDRRSLDDVRQAISHLKHVVQACQEEFRTGPAGKAAASTDTCKAAFDHVAQVCRRVGQELRTQPGDKSQTQWWRGKHIAHLLDGIEDESIAASASTIQGC